MKLLAHISTKKVSRSPGTFTFETKLVEVDAAIIIRTPARHDKDCYPWKVLAWHYGANIDGHPELAPDAIRIGAENRYHVNVNRRLNPKWKPPVFPEGKNWVDVQGLP